MAYTHTNIHIYVHTFSYGWNIYAKVQKKAQGRKHSSTSIFTHTCVCACVWTAEVQSSCHLRGTQKHTHTPHTAKKKKNKRNFKQPLKSLCPLNGLTQHRGGEGRVRDWGKRGPEWGCRQTVKTVKVRKQWKRLLVEMRKERGERYTWFALVVFLIFFFGFFLFRAIDGRSV